MEDSGWADLVYLPNLFQAHGQVQICYFSIVHRLLLKRNMCLSVHMIRVYQLDNYDRWLFQLSFEHQKFLLLHHKFLHEFQIWNLFFQLRDKRVVQIFGKKNFVSKFIVLLASFKDTFQSKICFFHWQVFSCCKIDNMVLFY